jgi:hypothetical protein
MFMGCVVMQIGHRCNVSGVEIRLGVKIASTKAPMVLDSIATEAASAIEPAGVRALFILRRAILGHIRASGRASGVVARLRERRARRQDGERRRQRKGKTAYFWSRFHFHSPV